jgi:phosphatidylglycerol:prolipoprotein diacylglycerol transferase
MPLYFVYPSWIRPEVIPGLPVRWYGLMYLVAFLVTYALFRFQVKKNRLDISTDDSLTMFIWIMVSALLMARIFATTVYDSTGKFLRQPWLIFWPFDGQGNFTGFQGMSYFGGLVGAILGAYLWSKKYRQDLLLWGDLLVHGFPLGYFFGRLGNFINGELYGRITSSPLGVLFPYARRVRTEDPEASRIIGELGLDIPADQLTVNLPRHASQLYEAFAEGILLWILLWFIVRPRKPYRGFSVAIYVIGYSAARFVVEFFRELDPGFDFYTAANLSLGQLFCLAGMAAGGIALLLFHRSHHMRPKVETFSE